MVFMLNLSEASPRWRHWRDAASATRQAKSGDGGHDLIECQAPEVRWAAVSHQESCCPRFEPVRARAHLERVHASPPDSGYIHWGCPKHARQSAQLKDASFFSCTRAPTEIFLGLDFGITISGLFESFGLGIENPEAPRGRQHGERVGDDRRHEQQKPQGSEYPYVSVLF